MDAAAGVHITSHLQNTDLLYKGQWSQMCTVVENDGFFVWVSYPDILSYESCLSAVVESRFTLLHQITAAVM